MNSKLNKIFIILSVSFILLNELICIVNSTPTSNSKNSTSGKWFTSNGIQAPEGCIPTYKCKRTVKLNGSKVCSRYCSTIIDCDDGEKHLFEDSCFDIDVNWVFDDEETEKPSGHIPQPAHIIDVKCKEGYLPDRNGKCRPIW